MKRRGEQRASGSHVIAEQRDVQELLHELETQLELLQSDGSHGLHKVEEVQEDLQGIKRDSLDRILSQLEGATASIADSLFHISTRSQLMAKKALFEPIENNSSTSQSFVSENGLSRSELLGFFDLMVPTTRQVVTIFNVHQLAACELLLKLSTERKDIQHTAQSLSRSFANAQNALKSLHTSSASLRSFLRDKSTSKRMIIPVASISQTASLATIAEEVVYDKFFEAVDALLTCFLRLGGDWTSLLRADNEFLARVCLGEEGKRREDVAAANGRLERSLQGLVKAAESLQNKLNGGERSNRLEFLTMIVREAVENVGDLVVLLVEFVHSLENKNDCDRLAGYLFLLPLRALMSMSLRQDCNPASKCRRG